MIHEVVPAFQAELNKFLKSKHNLNEDKVILSQLVNADGSMAVQESDKIILTVVNIEPDRSKSNTGSYEQLPTGNFTKITPPVNVMVYLLFSAYFTPENYLEGIKFITSTIAFFQSRNGIFTPQNTPMLSGQIDRLVAELVALDFRELSNVWSGLGAKYLPSALYRIKTIPVQHQIQGPTIPVIKKT